MMGKRRLDATETLDGPADMLTETRSMIHPFEDGLTRPFAVRDGHGAPVTCADCGCRLERTGEAWFHFNPIAGRDARGCRVACADAAHDTAGRAIAVAV
jgi:hypothetical protein